ncbi:hypothetical protein Tco_1392880 [Tanacetum coccineum]
MSAKFDESFYEAWDRFNDLLRAGPHHGFSELHQLDTFYNALNINDQDSLNSAQDIVPALLLDKRTKLSAPLQRLHLSNTYQAPVPQTHSVTKNNFDNYVKANDAIMRNMQNNLQNQGQSMQIETNKLNNQMANLTDMLAKFVTANTASTSGSGTLPGNTVTNPREDFKGYQLPEACAYQGPPIPTSSSDIEVVDFEPDPRVPLIPGGAFLKTSRALIDVHKVKFPLRIMIPIVATSSPTLTPYGDSDFPASRRADSFSLV